jgi:MFS family permease
VHTRQFWLVFFMLVCFGYCMISIMVHIVPHAIDLGIPAVLAANILAIRGGMGILGSYWLGALGDRIGNRKLFMIGFGLITANLLWLIPAGEVWMLYVFGVFFGLAVGGMGASESPLVASLFGLRSHGLIYGVMGLGFTLGASTGPIITGYIFDITGSYTVAFWLCTAFAVAGLVTGGVLKPTRR